MTSSTSASERGHANLSSNTVSTRSASSSVISDFRCRVISSMPVCPAAERTRRPPPISATLASCASPSAVSCVVSGRPCSSVRQPTTCPSGPTSGMRSGVRPPICTTSIVVPSAAIARATATGSPSRSSPSVMSRITRR